MSLTPKQLRQLRKADLGGANRIRFARTLIGLTQEELAQAVGVSQTGLSDLERQRYGDTTLDTARRFTTFFGCHIEDLFPAKSQEAAAS